MTISYLDTSTQVQFNNLHHGDWLVAKIWCEWLDGVQVFGHVNLSCRLWYFTNNNGVCLAHVYVPALKAIQAIGCSQIVRRIRQEPPQVDLYDDVEVIDGDETYSAVVVDIAGGVISVYDELTHTPHNVEPKQIKRVVERSGYSAWLTELDRRVEGEWS